MSDRVGYELLEIPDTPPDGLATQDFGRLRSYFGARRQRSVCFRRRGGEDEKLSSREQDQTVGEKATLGSHLPPHSRGTSCRLQYSSRRDGFTRKQDHQQCRSSSSECFHPHQNLCHQSEGLPTDSHMETCSMSREDENNRTLNIDELFQTAREEIKRNDKNTTSGLAIPTPMQNRRKMLVRNGRISPNGVAADEAMSNKSVKRLRDASVEGHVMNDESADANSYISCDFDFKRNDISLPIAAQQEDRRKGKAIVSGVMDERDKNNCIQFLQRRKRLRVNSSCSEEVNRFSVCRDSSSHWPCGSSGLAAQGNSQVYRNDVFLNTRTSNVVQESSCDVKVDGHVHIDVDSLEDPVNEIVNLEERNKEASARARLIEQDKHLAKQLRGEFASEELKGGLQNQRKMMVYNGGISPNGITAVEAMSSKRVKRQREASVEGPIMNDESVDAYSFISCDCDFQPNNICLPFAAQQEDRRKDKAIVCGDMVERDENNFVQLLQRRKRMRVNSSSSREVNRESVCRDGSSPCSSSSLATQGKIQACKNDVFLNSSRDDASERNIKFTCKPQDCSRVHRNERQLERLDKTRGGLPSLSLVGDQRNSSEAGSPEVVFLRSTRTLRRNHSSTGRNSNVVQESSCGVKVDNRTPIDVNSLEYPINETVNLEESNKEASARARQIEQDELLAKQLQEEFAWEEREGGIQQDDPISALMVRRELREHVATSDSDFTPVSAGLRASFGTGNERELSHSLTVHPSLASFSAGHSTVPLHRRRDALSGRWHRASGRPFHGSRFHFPSHRNPERRVDVLEAMEHAVESNATHWFLAGVQRDFNENDYEMLLALDDDNSNWKSASQRHIDCLPISTVQKDISDEVCSICLEMPNLGEVIRHLLCMHKFHKECIDPWLAKQASCPICKLSI